MVDWDGLRPAASALPGPSVEEDRGSRRHVKRLNHSRARNGDGVIAGIKGGAQQPVFLVAQDQGEGAFARS